MFTGIIIPVTVFAQDYKDSPFGFNTIFGWGVLKSMRRMKIHIKGDERILWDSDFVEKVLSQASEQMELRYRLKAEGWTLTKITERVAEIFGIEK